MFGQQNRPAFGGTFGSSNTTTPFGAIGATTKSSGFGSTGTSTFGASSGFGGQSTPSASTSIFGSSSTSTPATGGMFGGGTSGGGFTFGQATPQQNQQTGASSIFSSIGASNTQQQSSSLFSTPTNNAAFGTKTPAGAFGTTTQNTGGLFGSSTTNTGLFGSTSTANPTGGLFGTTTTSFNAGTSQQQSGTVVKYVAPTGQDTMLKGGVSTNINTRHQCISAMKEYENKSLEELRYEDYAANRKGPQAGSTTGSSVMFGATSTQQQPQSSGFSLFGQANQSQPKPTFGGFGTTTSTGNTGGLFGQSQTQTQSTGLFGSTATSKPLFGGATTTSTASSGFSGFAQPNTGSTSLFGQSQQKPGGLFGSTPQNTGTSLFGNPTSSSTSTSGFSGFGSGFGTNTSQQSATAQGGMFAKPGGFGPAPAATLAAPFSFGGTSAQPQQTSLFGQNTATTKPTGFAFGQSTTSTQSTGLFGAKPAAPFSGSTLGGFGTTNTLGGGSTLGTGTTGGLFGQQAKPFGQNLGTTLGTATNSFGGGGTTGGGLLGSGAPTLGSDVNAAAAQQTQITQQLMALNTAPYGDNPLFRNLKQNDAKREELTKPTNPTAQKAALNTSTQYKVNSRPTAKIKPKPIHSIANGKAQLFEGLEEDEASTFGNDTFQPRRSVKKLVIKGDGNRSLNHSQLSSSRAASDTGTDELVAPSPIVDAEKSSDRNPMPGAQEHSSLPVRTSTEKRPTQPDSLPDFSQQKKSTRSLDSTIVELNVKNRLRTALEESRFDSSGEQDAFDNLSDGSSSPVPHPAGLVLKRPGYYTLPSLEDLSECVEDDGSCIVENFVVGREGYGNVMFPGEINIAGLNLDDIVHFRRKEITIYPDDENKPEVGKGLNTRAQVTLDCVWPTDKTTHSPIKNAERLHEMAYQDRLERASSRIGAKFIDYRPETGSWVFEVKHFSKYGLVDSDDEDAETDPEKLKQLKEQQQKLLAVQKQKIITEQEKLHQQKIQGALKPTINLRVDEDDMMDDASNTNQNGRIDESEKVDLSSSASMPRSFGLQGLQPPLSYPDTVMHGENDREKNMHSPTAMDEMDDMDQVPTSHRLALGLGVRAHDLQIRKASFFGEEEEEGESGNNMEKHKFQKVAGFSGFVQSPLQQSFSKSVVESPERSMWSTSFKQPAILQQQQQQFSPNKPLSPYRSAFIQPSHKAGVQKVIPGNQEHMLIPSGMTEIEPKRKVVGTRVQRSIPALKDSLLNEKQRCLSDIGLYHGRKFRVGWGPHWSMSHCGDPLMKEEDKEEETPKFHILPGSIMSTSQKRLDASPFQLCLERVHSDPQLIFTEKKTSDLVRQCLEIQLTNSECNTDNKCPLFSPKIGVDALHRYASELNKQTESWSATHPDKSYVDNMSVVWNLCVALWGNIPELMIEEDGDKNSYHYHMARREALSRWINEVSVPKVDEEVEKVRSKGMTEINAVYSHLSARQISEACSVAQDCGDHRLALLIAQAVSADVMRNMLKQQLSTWEETQADQFIEPSYLKVYTLLAGHMVWPASHLNINTCDSLDWKRCLGLHLWYYCPPQATISDALRHYNHAYQGTSPQDKYAAPPLPNYLEEEEEEQGTLKLLSGNSSKRNVKIQDVCYHLLQLYSDRAHELHVLLNPSSMTPNTLDYRLSWHLGQVLLSLEYQHLSEYHHASLCCNYASQLESMGLWHWAVFVLLHIENHIQREGSVKELLHRHIEIDCEEEELEIEQFIFERLHVPVEWKHEAKAIKAHAEGRSHEEAWHLLKGHKWNQSHEILLKHVASEAIINEHFDYLKKFLLELGSSEHCSYIKDWATGGKVFLDYINMIQTIEQLKQGEPSGYELERLLPEVTSLAKRISHLPCYNSKDRLCQSEMAKRVANVMKTLMAMQHPDEDVSARLLAPIITQLPMPEDYALQELRQLTHSYMMELTMS